MSSKILYRFKLDINGTVYTVNPIYNDGAEIESNRQAGQYYKRKKFNGVLLFEGEEADLINAQDFETEFILTIEASSDEGQTYTAESPQMVFTRIDGKVDEDRNTVEVTPESRDDYELFLNGQNIEVDLLELEPAVEEIDLTKRPLMQIYFLGSSVLSNLIGGVYWETPVTPVTSSLDLQNIHRFGLSSWAVVIQGNLPISGAYTADNLLTPTLFTKSSGDYEIVKTAPSPGRVIWKIRPTGGSFTYEAPERDDTAETACFGDPTFSGTVTAGDLFTSLTDPAETVRAFGAKVFIRVLTNLTTVDGVNSYALDPDNDINYPAAYTRALAVVSEHVVGSESAESTPTRFGKVIDTALYNAGLYFSLYAGGVGSAPYYPVSRSDWSEVSFWIYSPETVTAYDGINKVITTDDAAEDYTLKHAYPLESALDVLLKHIDSNLGHQAAAAYSDFFYNASNVVKPDSRRLFLVPKSNVILGEYDQPAQTAKLRLVDLLEALRVFYNVYYYLEDGKLILEHIQFFLNGKSYTAENIDKDFTSLLDPYTGKNWSYGTNRYEYKKSEVPKQIVFKQMDEVSDAFEGYPVVIRSSYGKTGEPEERAAALITTDVDFIHSQGPAAVTKNGFVMFETETSGGRNVVPFVTFVVDASESYKMQNGYLSGVYLRDAYFKYGLPASLVTINRQDLTALSVLPIKIQSVDFPNVGGIDDLKKVTTALGSGLVVKKVLNLSNGFSNYELEYEP